MESSFRADGQFARQRIGITIFRQKAVANRDRYPHVQSPYPWLALVRLFAFYLSLEAASSARRIVPAGTRRNFFAKPIFESVQMIHFVGSNCHGFTPFR